MVGGLCHQLTGVGTAVQDGRYIVHGGESPHHAVVEWLQTLIGQPFVVDDALTVATVHAAANLVAHGIGEVGAAFGFAEGGKVVEVVLLVEGAVKQRLVAFVHVSLCQLHVMAVLAGQQCLVE